MPLPVGTSNGPICVADLVQALPDAAVALDLAGRVLHANQAALDLFGLAASELARLSPGDWAQAVAQRFPRLTPVPDAGAPWHETLQSAGRGKRFFRRTSRPVRSAQGQVIGRLELLRDISEDMQKETDRAQAESQRTRQLEALESQLEQAEKYRSELTGNVSHDLKTPLATIKATASGLLAGDVTFDPAAWREALSTIEQESDRLQRRVQNLLSMSRMEAGGAPLQCDWVDLADLCAATIESLRSIRGDREIRIELADDLPLVFADYDQLLIAVRNLLENALLYSPANTPIDLSVRRGIESVKIRVRDYGPGLRPEEFERVFQKFYRGHAAQQIPGTGLGLPICQGIAEAHGGRLWAEHAPGGGVVFVLSLPLKEQPDLMTNESLTGK